MPVIQFSELYSGNEKCESLAFNKNARDSSDVLGGGVRINEDNRRIVQAKRWQEGEGQVRGKEVTVKEYYV